MCRYYSSEMEIPPTMLRKAKRDNSSVWVDHETFDAASEGGLDRAFIEVGPPSDWGMLIPEEDKRVCSNYDGCAIPCQECLFFLIGICLPFNKFEVGVLNHLLIIHSQLHMVNWVYVEVFQY